jgi:hypothetical protein
MKKTVVTTQPVRVPKEIEQLFDEPALVGDELRESYNAVFSILATARKAGRRNTVDVFR